MIHLGQGVIKEISTVKHCHLFTIRKHVDAKVGKGEGNLIRAA